MLPDLRGSGLPDLIGALEGFLGNPAVYLLLVFVYAVLVAVILPIPIEIALIWPFVNGQIAFFIAVSFAMAVGKALGALFIFWLGIKVEKSVHYWSDKFKWFGKVVHYLSIFVKKTGYIGLYAILSIPLMTDTVPIYIYSIFHEEGKKLKIVWFGLSNFLAALTRATIIVAIITLFGVTLV